MTDGSPAAAFARLADVDDGEADIYTTLAPLYRIMYTARGRIDGQLATVREHAPADAGTVLELGCGTGDLLGALGERYEFAVGADPSPAMCRLAARHGPVCRADARGVAPRRVDLVVVVGAVLGHLRPDDEAQAALDHIRETLRPGGRVVCTVHDRRALDGPRERSLTRTVDGYELTQTDEQRPTGGGEFDWRVAFTMTAPSGERRRASTTTTLRAFEPAALEQWFTEAGLSVVETHPRTYVDGDGEDGRAFVIVAERC
jgi:SAM-dependent methyltransferase